LLCGWIFFGEVRGKECLSKVGLGEGLFNMGLSRENIEPLHATRSSILRE